MSKSTNQTEDITRVIYHVDCFYPIIFLIHYALFQIVILSKSCDKVKNEKFYRKVLLYHLSILYEIIFTLLITFYCLPEILVFLYKNEMHLTTQNARIVYLSGVVFWTLYAYEMTLNYKDPLKHIQKQQIPQLTIHHITALIRLTIANICIRFSASDDVTVRTLICYVYGIGMYHAALDFIMHIPLLLWRLNLFYRIRFVFFWLSYWPLLFIRCIIYILIAAIYLCFYFREYHFSVYAYIWIFSHTVLLVIQFGTQIIGSQLMKKIYARDQIQHDSNTDSSDSCSPWNLSRDIKYETLGDNRNSEYKTFTISEDNER